MANLPTQSQIARHTAQVAAIFDAVCTANQAMGRLHYGSDPRSYFDCVEVPALSIKMYMTQLNTMRREAVWPVALILADRYCRMADVPFNPHVVHRLVLVAYVVAHKLCYDLCRTSGVAAPLGSVSLQDLNTMEEHFLHLVDFDCHVTAREFAAVVDQLDNIEAAARHAALNPTQKPADLIPEHLVPTAESPNMESMAPQPPSQPRSRCPSRPTSNSGSRQCPHADSAPPTQVRRAHSRIYELKNYVAGPVARTASG